MYKGLPEYKRMRSPGFLQSNGVYWAEVVFLAVYIYTIRIPEHNNAFRLDRVPLANIAYHELARHLGCWSSSVLDPITMIVMFTILIW
ncbi:hypothetical protein M434DRAFT_366670 [Hypoxylon sp. CO27-5]|nr:hypothetical protein M434DRAFT_366670 [Hypoxylon sp. CO27-5]